MAASQQHIKEVHVLPLCCIIVQRRAYGVTPTVVNWTTMLCWQEQPLVDASSKCFGPPNTWHVLRMMLTMQ